MVFTLKITHDIIFAVEEVNPTFTWPEEDLEFLKGSPVVPATKSLQIKLQKEYESFIGGEGGLCEKFPDKFPREVCVDLRRSLCYCDDDLSFLMLALGIYI